MRLQSWDCLAVLSLFHSRAIANPLGIWPSAHNWTMLMPRQDAEADQMDLTYIKKMAAIGDSYSAGIGAGARLGDVRGAFDGQSDWHCSRYKSSYPYVVNEQLSGDGRNFQFKSCSGAKIPDVLQHQIPNIDGGQQAILVSAGGNDAELVNILNLCVYQVAALTQLQGTAAKITALADARFEWAGDFDWDSISRGCEAQLDRSRDIINGGDFSRKLDDIITQAKSKLAPDGAIYYTGYAKFFAEDFSHDCDKVSWSTYIYKAANNFQSASRLTIDRRRAMNDLVQLMNQRLADAVSRAGPNVEFVDWDQHIARMKGRFCEAGVDESTEASNSRLGLMFYELLLSDPMGQTFYKRGEQNSPQGTFAATMDQYAMITQLLADPEVKYARAPHEALRTVDTSVKNVEMDNPIIGGLLKLIPMMLPDGYGRIFHPTKLCHQLIARLVLQHMINRKERSLGISQSPVVYIASTCPIGPKFAIDPPVLGSAGAPATPADFTQQIALASYIHPGVGKDLWTRMIDAPTDKVSVLVANVLSGPDAVVNTDWKSVIDRAVAKGKIVIGYVRTGYLGVSKQKFQTMLGSTALEDWVAQIEADVEMWYKLYPNIKGIFFDEGWNECGQQDMYAKLYRLINENTKRKHKGAYTVLNPGDRMPKCFENSADTLMTYERSFAKYMELPDNEIKNDWVSDNPTKLWHIIYKVPAGEVGRVIEKSKRLGAGLLHITTADLPNPYDSLPDEGYMNNLMSLVPGGKPNIEIVENREEDIAPNVPSGLKVTDADYTSVSLAWDDVDTAGSQAIAIYDHKGEILRIPPYMTRVTIGGLDIDQPQSFSIAAIGIKGKPSKRTGTVSSRTKPLPRNRPIIDAKMTQTDTETIFEADVLVPFAFVRVLIVDKYQYECKDKEKWPAPTDKGFVCSDHMIEGQTSFKFNGKKDAKGNMPWSWVPTSDLDGEGINMVVERNRYHYRWHYPFGKSRMEITNFMVQGEGVSPRANYFHPAPCDWKSGSSILEYGDKSVRYSDDKDFCPFNCEGHTLCSTISTKWCDKGINSLLYANRNTIYRSNAPNLAERGACWGNSVGIGCSVQIRGKDQNGKDCTMTGQELWDTYQEIRKQNLECGKCGSKHIGNGCVISSDYYTECGNRDEGVNRLISMNETDFETDFDNLGMTPTQNIANGMLFAFTVETPVKTITDTDGNSTGIAAAYTNSTISWSTTIETSEPADEAKAVVIENPTPLAMPVSTNS